MIQIPELTSLNYFLEEVGSMPVEHLIERLFSGEYKDHQKEEIALNIIVQSGYRFQTDEEMEKLKKTSCFFDLPKFGYRFSREDLEGIKDPVQRNLLLEYMAHKNPDVFSLDDILLLRNPFVTQDYLLSWHMVGGGRRFSVQEMKSLRQINPDVPVSRSEIGHMAAYGFQFSKEDLKELNIVDAADLESIKYWNGQFDLYRTIVSPPPGKDIWLVFDSKNRPSFAEFSKIETALTGTAGQKDLLCGFYADIDDDGHSVTWDYFVTLVMNEFSWTVKLESLNPIDNLYETYLLWRFITQIEGAIPNLKEVNLSQNARTINRESGYQYFIKL